MIKNEKTTERALTIDKKPFPLGGIALSANERIAEFPDFAIQARFDYVNKLRKNWNQSLKNTAGEKMVWLLREEKRRTKR